MTAKTDSSTLDRVIDLVRRGTSTEDVVRITGVSRSVISRTIKNAGVKPAGSVEKERIDELGEQMVTMYQNGESENAVAKHFNISRNVIRRQLERFGIEPRTQSEAESLKWSKMTEEQRKLQTVGAHESVKGVPRSDIAKIHLAQARERIKYDYLIGPGETTFIEQLNNRGINHIHQKAVKFYNVDIAIGNVAVELTSDGNRYSSFNPKEIKRAKNLLECGFHTLAVQFDTEETLVACTDDIIDTVNEMSSLESFVSQYWVVSCRSQDYTIVKNDLGQFTSVKSPVKFITKRSVVEL